MRHWLAKRSAENRKTRGPTEICEQQATDIGITPTEQDKNNDVTANSTRRAQLGQRNTSHAPRKTIWTRRKALLSGRTYYVVFADDDTKRSNQYEHITATRHKTRQSRGRHAGVDELYMNDAKGRKQGDEKTSGMDERLRTEMFNNKDLRVSREYVLTCRSAGRAQRCGANWLAVG